MKVMMSRKVKSPQPKRQGFSVIGPGARDGACALKSYACSL